MENIWHTKHFVPQSLLYNSVTYDLTVGSRDLMVRESDS